MSIKVSAANADVRYLANTKGATLSKDEGILYLRDDISKIGQVARSKDARGKTPQKAAEDRYKGMKSAAHGDITFSGILVFKKVHGDNFDYDGRFRIFLHELHDKGLIPFDSQTHQFQIDGKNRESLIGYDHSIHWEILVKAAEQYFGLVQHWDTKKPITWKWEQDTEIDLLVDILNKKHLALYAAYTSRGKTLISIAVMVALNPKGGLVLITTPVRDTRDSFEEAIRDWHFGSDRSLKVSFVDNKEFAKTSVDDLRERVNQGELIFIVLTVQDMIFTDEGADSEQIRVKYNSLAGKLDGWVRDERHKNYGGKVTSTKLVNLSATNELDLTATPYDCIDQYDSDCVLFRGLIWGLMNRENTGLPNLRIESWAAPFSSLDPKLSHMYTVEEGYNPEKITQRSKNGSFLLQQALVDQQNLCYASRLSKKKNPFSINQDPDLDDVSKRNGMWVWGDGTDGDSAKLYLPALAKLFNHHAKKARYYIDSYELEKQANKCGKTIAKYVATLIEEHGVVIILTCGKFLTGTNIPTLGHIVLMRNIESLSEFEQLNGREVREYKDKEGVKKERVKTYTTMSGQQLTTTLGRLYREASLLSGISESEMYDCAALTDYDLTGNVRTVPFIEILAAGQKAAVASIPKLPTYSLGKYLEGVDLSAFRADLLKFRKGKFKTERFSEKNGAKVSAHISKEDKTEKKCGSLLENAILMIQTVVAELSWVAYTNDCYDYEKLLADKSIIEMFGKDTIGSLLYIIKNSVGVEKTVRDYLLKKQRAYSNSPIEAVMDDVFLNSTHKLRMGLVYLPLSAARHIINNEHVKNVKRVLVYNARNGSVVLALRERFPKVEIVCAEQYPQYTAHLKSRFGVGVIENVNTVDDLIKIPNIESFDFIFNEPPVNARGEARTYILFNKAFLELPQKPLVASVLPDKTGSTAADIARHNERIARHNYTVIRNLNDYYPEIGGYTKKGDHICAISSMKRVNKIKTQTPIKVKLTKLSLPFPERKRIVAIVGSEKLALTKKSGSVKIIEKIVKDRNRKSPHIQYKSVSSEEAFSVRRKTDAPYLVLSNRRARNGKLNVSIVRNTKNTRWSRWVFAYPASSKVDALKLAKWLVSKTVRDCIIKMVELRDGSDAAKNRKGSDTPTITKSMLNLIPYYR